jgi:ParE toxin of type II toxin-antitoxin system, parDE
VIVLFREVAETELEAAWRRYAEIDPELGRRFLEQANAALERAAENAESYQVLEADIRHVRLRRFPHALYFRLVGNALVVIAVAHPSRHPAIWWSRR